MAKSHHADAGNRSHAAKGARVQSALVAACQQRMLAIADCRSDLESSDLEDEQLLSRRAIDMVLDSCEEETRQAFLRVVVGREHPADVARDLGMTANAIYVAKSRILRRIRHEFAELVDF